MTLEIDSEINHVEDIPCDNSMKIKNYWQAKIMLAISCDEINQTIKAAFIFKINGIMIMKTHNID